MKKLFTLMTIVVVILVIDGCKKNKDDAQTHEFSMTTFTNPTDPTLLQVSYEDGMQVTYSGTKDATGFPVKIEFVNVTFPDMEGDFLVTLDDNMLPARQTTPNGTVFEYLWNNDNTMRLTAISPGGEVQVSIPVDLTGTKSLNVLDGLFDQSPANIREGLPAKLTFSEFPQGGSEPLKPAGNNAMIFHVKKCGVDVSNATVVLKVDPPLGQSRFPCKYDGNGFYSTGIPQTSDVPAPYEEECDKIGTIVKDVCAAYDFISLFGGNLSSQICQLLSTQIAAAFPGNPDGQKILNICSKGMKVIEAFCDLSKKTDIAALCKINKMLNAQPTAAYSFTVEVAVPGSGTYIPASQTFDPDNPQTYLVDMGGTFDISGLKSSPPNPAAFEGYTASADIICPDPSGTSVTISVVGSDNYSDSHTETFTVNGQISLVVPGGAQSVRDVVTVTGGGKTVNIVIIFQ